MYQTGGAVQSSILQEIAKLPQDQQKKIMAAFGKWAQSKGLNIQQLQKNEQALEQAMGQFLQEMQGAQKARLGAKLNYIRSLKGNAPEGMDIEYYKCGGQVKKKFIKKNACGSKGMAAIKAFKDKCGSKMKKKSCKEFGGEIQSDKCGSKMKKSKKEFGGEILFDKCGSKMKKKSCRELGGNIESDKCGSKMKAQNGMKTNSKTSNKWTQKDDKKLLNYRRMGTKTPAEKKDSIAVQRKWNRLPEKEKAKYEVQEQKCEGKAKKHFYGGSLNRIPFYQRGTSKGGIEKSDNTRVSRIPNKGEAIYKKTSEGYGDFLPIVGTYRAAQRIDRGEPNASYGDLIINGGMDLLGAKMIGSVVKAAGKANRIHKALKSRGFTQITKEPTHWVRMPKYGTTALGNKLYSYQIPFTTSAVKVIPNVDYTNVAIQPLIQSLRVPATAPFKK